MARRFTHPDPAVDLHGSDLAWPLSNDGNGDLAEVVGEANTLSALAIRACTRRGEIEFFPDDGIDLDDLQGALITDDERAALKARLIEQYRDREDRLASVDVDVGDGRSSDETLAEIHARFRSGRVETVSVPFGGG